jgi:hypothetical protein
MQRLFKIFALSLLEGFAIASAAQAVTVSPRGVNVRTFGATTVFLTFAGLTVKFPQKGYGAVQSMPINPVFQEPCLVTPCSQRSIAS